MSDDCVCIEIECVTWNDFFNITWAVLLGTTSPLIILTRTSCIPNVGSCPAGRHALHSTNWWPDGRGSLSCFCREASGKKVRHWWRFLGIWNPELLGVAFLTLILPLLLVKRALIATFPWPWCYHTVRLKSPCHLDFRNGSNQLYECTRLLMVLREGDLWSGVARGLVCGSQWSRKVPPSWRPLCLFCELRKRLKLFEWRGVLNKKLFSKFFKFLIK